MKVALIVCGQYRGSVEGTTQSIVENLIEPNNADVYVSTWDYGIKSSHRSPFQGNAEKIRTSADMFKYPNIVDFIQSKEIDISDLIHPSRIQGLDHTPMSIVCHNELMGKALESIKAKGIRYDMICKVRPDLTILDKLIIYKNDYINLSLNTTHMFACSDKLFYCSYDTFYELARNLREGAEVLKEKLDPHQPWAQQAVGERFMRQIVKKMNLKTTIIDGRHQLCRQLGEKENSFDYEAKAYTS